MLVTSKQDFLERILRHYLTYRREQYFNKENVSFKNFFKNKERFLIVFTSNNKVY